jgi:hypothetical protein
MITQQGLARLGVGGGEAEAERLGENASVLYLRDVSYPPYVREVGLIDMVSPRNRPATCSQD